MLDENNRKTYRSPSIIRYYTALSALQPAEETIFALLGDRLSEMNTLDLGVGGGRTTPYLAPRVAAYTGLDYSAEMIDACRQRFAGDGRALAWVVGDARNLSRFADNSFDFVLFSFNGIDYMPPIDRDKVFREIARVGISGGYFCFSSHNLTAIEPEFCLKTRIGPNPLTSYVNLVMWAIFRYCNRSLTPKTLAASDHAMIRDEPHNFRLRTYYGRPRVQWKQLQLFFKDIHIFSWQTGREILNEGELDTLTDLWLYYLCVIP
jgi:SAM-dependent methyltransferase